MISNNVINNYYQARISITTQRQGGATQSISLEKLRVLRQSKVFLGIVNTQRVKGMLELSKNGLDLLTWLQIFSRGYVIGHFHVAKNRSERK